MLFYCSNFFNPFASSLPLPKLERVPCLDVVVLLTCEGRYFMIQVTWTRTFFGLKSRSRMKQGSFIILKYNTKFQYTTECSPTKSSDWKTMSPALFKTFMIFFVKHYRTQKLHSQAITSFFKELSAVLTVNSKLRDEAIFSYRASYRILRVIFLHTGKNLFFSESMFTNAAFFL